MQICVSLEAPSYVWLLIHITFSSGDQFPSFLQIFMAGPCILNPVIEYFVNNMQELKCYLGTWIAWEVNLGSFKDGSVVQGTIIKLAILKLF